MAAKKTTKKTEPTKPSKASRVRALKDQLNKTYKGKAILMTGDEYEAPFSVMRRPSGILSLDLAIGGGLPPGVSELIGAESSGKTSLLNLFMRRQQEIQKADCMLAMAMTETKYDKAHARFNCGLKIPMSKAEIATLEKTRRKQFTAEELKELRSVIGEFTEVQGATTENLYQAVIDMVEADVFDILGIDSWGNFLTQQMADGDMNDKTYGGAAGVNTQFANKIAPAFTMPHEGRMNYTSVVGINHYRAKVAGANPKAGMQTNMNIQGGFALKHLKLLSIYLEGSTLWQKVDGKNARVGRRIKWTVIKGKAGCSDGGTGEFNIIYGLGIDVAHANVMEAVARGVIRQSGSWLTLCDPDDDSVIHKCQGASKMTEHVREDPELHEFLKDATLRVAIERDGVNAITEYHRPEEA